MPSPSHGGGSGQQGPLEGKTAKLPVASAEHLETLASLLEKDKTQEDMRLAAELRRKAQAVRGAELDRPTTSQLTGLAHKHACEKVAKVEKRIEGYQQETDKLRARLTELDRLLAAANADLVEAEAKVEFERASLIRQGLLGGDMGEALRQAIEVPADMRGAQIEAQLHGVVDQLVGFLQQMRAQPKMGTHRAAYFGGDGGEEDMASSLGDEFADGDEAPTRKGPPLCAGDPSPGGSGGKRRGTTPSGGLGGRARGSQSGG